MERTARVAGQLAESERSEILAVFGAGLREVCMADESDARHERGVARLKELDDEPGGDAFLARMGDLGTYIVDDVFGDIHARDGDLSIEDRELIIVALLIAMGGCEPQVAAHLRACRAIDVSWTKLEEVVILTAPYAGVARAVNGMKVLRLEQEGEDRI
jgi:4-carboxymuconolactone decarboxylase